MSHLHSPMDSYIYVDIEVHDSPIYLSTISLSFSEFSSKDIGVVLMAVSIFLVLLQLTLLPKVNKKLGSKCTLIVSNALLAIISPLLPLFHYLHNEMLMKGVLVVHVIVCRASSFLALVSIHILINNSNPSDLTGIANGFSITLSAIGRLLGGAITRPLFSWSLTNVDGVIGNKNSIGFPLNQYFVFLVLSLWSVLIAAVTSCFIKKSLDYKTT